MVTVAQAWLLQLQRDAGNSAVVGALPAAAATPSVPSVPVIGPVPTAIPAGQPLPQEKAGSPLRPLGDTDVTGTSPPKWSIEHTRIDRGYIGRPRATTAGDVRLAARYPAPGVFPFEGGKLIVEDTDSAIIRNGEQEHTNDFHLAYHAVYDGIAAAINRLAARPPQTRKDLRSLHVCWRKSLNAELPLQLQAPPEAESPTKPWNDLLATLFGLSNERDSEGWHNMKPTGAKPQQLVAHKIPNVRNVKRVVYIGDIGTHGSQARIDAAAPWLRKLKR